MHSWQYNVFMGWGTSENHRWVGTCKNSLNHSISSPFRTFSRVSCSFFSSSHSSGRVKDFLRIPVTSDYISSMILASIWLPCIVFEFGSKPKSMRSLKSPPGLNLCRLSLTINLHDPHQVRLLLFLLVAAEGFQEVFSFPNIVFLG